MRGEGRSFYSRELCLNHFGNIDWNLAWENSQHLATLPLVFPPNDVWETSAEIPYWWRVTSLKSNFPRGKHHYQSALTRSGKWGVISKEFLRSFLRRHFAGKPVVTSRNIGCFLRLVETIFFFTAQYFLLMWRHLEGSFCHVFETALDVFLKKKFYLVLNGTPKVLFRNCGLQGRCR